MAAIFDGIKKFANYVVEGIGGEAPFIDLSNPDDDYDDGDHDDVPDDVHFSTLNVNVFFLYVFLLLIYFLLLLKNLNQKLSDTIALTEAETILLQ